MGKDLQLIMVIAVRCGVFALQGSHHPSPSREKHGHAASLQAIPGNLLPVCALAALRGTRALAGKWCAQSGEEGAGTISLDSQIQGNWRGRPIEGLC